MLPSAAVLISSGLREIVYDLVTVAFGLGGVLLQHETHRQQQHRRGQTQQIHRQLTPPPAVHTMAERGCAGCAPSRAHLHARRSLPFISYPRTNSEPCSPSSGASPSPPVNRRAGGDGVGSCQGSGLLVGEELLGLGFHAFLDDAPGVLVTFEHGLGRGFHLLVGGVRWHGGDVGIGVYVQQGGPIR